MKLTEEVIEEMCKLIKEGNYVKTACAKVGISYPVHYRWIHKGRNGVAPIYVQYMRRIQQAEAEMEARIVKSWTDQVNFDWHAAKEFLGRRFPDTWGGRENVVVKHTGLVTHNVNVSFDFSKLNDEELDILEKLVRKASKPGSDLDGESEPTPQ